MKKRILSALLALVMVLALLPATAFAVTTTDGTPKLPSAAGSNNDGTGTVDGKEVIYYKVDGSKVTTQTVSQYLGGGEAYGRVYGHWYWLDNKTDSQNPVYYEVESGIVASTAADERVTSGSWYKDQTDFTTTNASTGKSSLRGTSFTLLGNTSVDMSSGDWTSNSLRVNFAEIGTNVGTFTAPSSITSLTVDTTNSTIGKKGTVAGFENINRSSYATTAPGTSNVTLNATNVTFTSIGLVGRTNGVTLTNCNVGAIYMSGYTETNNKTPVGTAYNRQTLTINGSTVSGNIEVIGDSSTVNLNNTSAASQTVKATGHNGNVNVTGTTNVGKITVKSRAVASSPTQNNSIPRVSVTGGTVAGIEVDAAEAGNGSSSFTITRGNTGPVNITAAISAGKGTLTVAGSTITTAEVKEGSVILTGPVNSTGALTLGASGKTDLRISGSGINLAGISATGENLNISGWPTNEGRNNYYGTLALGNYAKGQITGGTFDAGAGAMPFNTEAESKWFNTSNVVWRAFLTNTGKGTNGAVVGLYGANELARAIQDMGTAATQDEGGNLMPIGQSGSNSGILTLKWGSGNMAKMKYNTSTPIVLPDEMNSQKIATWMWMDDTNKLIKSFIPGNSYTIDTVQNITLVADGTTEDVAQITRITGGTASPVSGSNIRATMSGNTINLTGAVPGGLMDTTSISLDLTTDAVGSDGNVIVIANVPVSINTKTKAAQFGDFWQGSNGAQTKDGKLVLSNGATYTVNGSGLNVSASNLDLVGEGTNGYPIEVNVGGKLSGYSADAKKALTALLNGGTAGMKISANCTAWAQAINAAQATITSTQTVESWRDNARNNVWSRGFKSPNSAKNEAINGYAVDNGYSFVPHSGSYTAAANAAKSGITSAFAQVYIVPYLQVNVTDYDAGSGKLEATLVPSYRVEVSGDVYAADMAYVAQQGRALSNLTGEMGSGITVEFNLGAAFASQKLHQDGKYVYAGNSGAWTFTHAGDTGLGSIVINSTDGLITLQIPNSDGTALVDVGCKYDSVQAAVDDTIPAKGNSLKYSHVRIDGSFNKSCAFNMTGVARTIEVEALGNQTVSCTSNYVDAPQINGMTYTFQLKKDTATGGNVVISVQTATNGAATASATRAKAGQTVTITATPNAGYSTLGMTAVGNNNVNISVTGSGNSWSFKVPENVTSVTVTPRFGIAGQATVSVNNNTNGTVTVAGNASTVAQGSTVTVYTSPRAGYRATSVSVRFSNGSTVNATSAGTNTWTFTVPANATTVTVTPNFSVDTGLPFLDVAPTEYYLPYVRFVYSNGMMKGDGNDYTFNGNGNITRAQIVLILYRLSGSPTVSTITSFTDVPTNEWYSSAVAWAASNKIVEGRSTTKFDPGTAITRQELAAILYRYNNFRGLSGANLSNLSQFTDRGYVSNYALTPMQWAVGNGIITGTTTNTLSPSGTATRYQAATMLTRYCQAFLKMV